jgi:hypothetical protein
MVNIDLLRHFLLVWTVDMPHLAGLHTIRGLSEATCSLILCNLTMNTQTLHTCMTRGKPDAMYSATKRSRVSSLASTTLMQVPGSRRCPMLLIVVEETQSFRKAYEYKPLWCAEALRAAGTAYRWKTEERFVGATIPHDATKDLRRCQHSLHSWRRRNQFHFAFCTESRT